MFRPLSSTQRTVDLAVAGGFFVLFALPGGIQVDRMLITLVLAAGLAFRRWSPGIALGISWVGALTQMGLGMPPDPSDAAILAVLFATAAYGSNLVRWVALASAVVGGVLVGIYLFLLPALIPFPSSNSLDAPAVHSFVLVSIAAVVTFVLVWTAGLLLRTWNRARDRTRAATVAENEVAAEQERNRIARDMHDVVAHSLAVVVAQADGARYLGRTDPAATEAALVTIATTAREALSDVRLLLAQLRHSQGDGPQPVLADLDRLLDQLRASGLEIAHETEGAPLQLGTGPQLAIYRIVQESLTNALRHGEPGSPVVLHFGWSESGLHLTVRNAVRTAKERAESSGHGIAGMTERALLVGGSLTTTTDDGAFVVRVWIPAHPATVSA